MTGRGRALMRRATGTATIADFAERVAARDPFQLAESVSLAESGSNATFLAPHMPAYRGVDDDAIVTGRTACREIGETP